MISSLFIPRRVGLALLLLLAAAHPAAAEEISYEVLTQPDAGAQPNAAVQPPTEDQLDPQPVRPDPSERRRAARSRRRSRRLASTPPMFGDLITAGVLQANAGGTFVTADLLLAGGARRAKVAEHNLALPQDRVFFHYNVYHNAASVDRSLLLNGPLFATRSTSVARYTLGFERTFADEQWSLEARMPFTSEFSHVDGSFVMSGGETGNLTAILKRILIRCDDFAASIGMGIDIPTGDDVQGRLPVLNLAFSADNRSVHLLPYIGFVANRGERVFWNGFAQLDIPLNGNPVSAQNIIGNVQSAVINDQTLLHLDLSGGVWLHRNPCSEVVTGIAAIAELHHTTSLQDPDRAPLFAGLIDFASSRQIDVTNFTAGLHFEIAQLSQFRIAGAFPLANSTRRFFDGELIAAWIRRF